jgi:Flp pilus assembly pilin Flp
MNKTNESGQGLSEYMILVMLIAVGAIAASETLGNTIKNKLTEINTRLEEMHVR